MEDMDVTDKNFRPCKCGYQICLFCYRHIKDDLNGLCPACRTPYDEANATFVTPDPQEMAKMAREKKAKEAKDKKEQQAKEAKEKREAEIKSRQEVQARAAAAAAASASGAGGSSVCSSSAGLGSSSGVAPGAVAARAAREAAAAKVALGSRADPRDLSGMRLVQRTLVFVTGLSPRIAKEEIMRRQEYFGQYGKILKVVLGPAPPSVGNPGPPSLSCSITYSNRDEAEQAILAVDGVVLDGRTLKATFGGAPARPALAQDLEQDDGRDEQLRAVNAPPPAPAARTAPLASRVPQPSVSGSSSWGSTSPVPPAQPPGSTRVGAPGVAPPVQITPPPRAAPVEEETPLPLQHASPAPSAGAITPPGPIGGQVAGAAAAKQQLHSTLGPSALGGGAPLESGAIGGGGAIGGTPIGSLNRVPLCSSSMCTGITATGDAEPWSMSGFEALLTEIVSEDTDESAAGLTGSSRFARFFTDELEEAPSEASPAPAPANASGLAGLGLGLDPQKGAERQSGGGQQQEDWQQAGFRALLPNVNISFSPLSLGALDGLGGGGAAFGELGSAGPGAAIGGPGQTANLGGAPNGGGPMNGGTSASSSIGPHHGQGGAMRNPHATISQHAEQGSALGNIGSLGPQLGPAGLNGSSLTTSSPPSEPQVSLLSQLGGGSGLLSAQLPAAQLSSQLQSLLQGSNGIGGAATCGIGGAIPGAAGGAARAPGTGEAAGGAAGAAGLWSGNAGGAAGAGVNSSCLMPGWLPSEGLLSSLPGEQLSALDQIQKEAAAAGGAKPFVKKDAGVAAAGPAGGTDRSVKPKKRGGTSNRGKAAEMKVASHK